MGRKILMLLGHPGAGKGTQARAIMHHLKIPQISTGDILRDAVARDTSYGREVKAKMDAGKLVSDEVVNGIVAERIQREDCRNGFILDGYPRTVQQAETFHTQLARGDGFFVIEIGADEESLVQRLVGRLTCSGCGEIYNQYSRAPKNDLICDRCGRALIHRSDDREDLVRERFRRYWEETYPLIEFYRKLGAYHRVEGMRPVEEVTRDIMSIVHHEEALTPAPNGGKQSFA
jgi:adenylate kinase